MEKEVMDGRNVEAGRESKSAGNSKRPYRTPQLIVHGTVEEITAGGAGGPQQDTFGGS
jgi:hypothetical protein